MPVCSRCMSAAASTGSGGRFTLAHLAAADHDCLRWRWRLCVQVGAQARLMSQALRKLAGNVNRTKCTIIFINQIRMKVRCQRSS